MDSNKKDSKKKKTETTKLAIHIEDTIKEINTYICSAQVHLLSKCQEIINSQKEMEIILPTVFHQVINQDGTSEMQKISEAKLPFGYLLPPGIFQINNVDVELPINIEKKAISNGKTKTIPVSRTNEVNTNATLRLSYEYQKLSPATEPVVLTPNPIIDLVFKDFKIDSLNRKKCTANGIVEIIDENSGKPLENEQIFLNINEGNILPATGKLNEKGMLQFKILGNCQEDKKFAADISVVINGIKRSFNVLLSQ